MRFDIIGDIHGHAEPLKALLYGALICTAPISVLDLAEDNLLRLHI